MPTSPAGNGHPLVSYPGVTVEQQLDYVKNLGARSYRVGVPGVDKIPKLHKLVRQAKIRGIEILPIITPAFDLGGDPPDVLEKKAYDLAFLRMQGDMEGIQSRRSKTHRISTAIWVTEFNHPLGSQKSEQEQVEGLAETIAYLRRYQVPL